MTKGMHLLSEEEREREQTDMVQGTIHHYDRDAPTLDERLQPFRSANLSTMRYALSEEYATYWYMHRVFSAVAAKCPDETAVSVWQDVHEPSVVLSYRQLDNITSALASCIASFLPVPIMSLPVCVIYLNRGAPLIASIIGIMKTHCAMVVVEDNAPLSRLFFVLKDTNAFLLITSAELQKNVNAAVEEMKAKGESAEFPSHMKALIIDSLYDDLQRQYTTPRALSVASTTVPPSGPVKSPMPELGDHSPMCIIYTSGSTGRPKGVILEYGAFTNYAAIEQVVCGMRPRDRVLQTQSLSFIAGFHEIWRPLLCGGTLYFSASKAIPMLGPDLVDWLHTHRINIFKAVPSLLRTLIVKSDSGPPPNLLPHLRILHIGGEPITPELVDYFASPHRNFLNTYGSTETNSNCCIGQCYPGKTVTIGRALPTYTARILKDGKDVEVGELHIGGKSLAREYLNLPEASKKFWHLENFGRLFATGDMVEYLSEDGALKTNRNIKFCGRADRQIKINGYRVELDEIEVAIRRVPIVKESVCVFKNSILIAFIQPMQHADLDMFAVKSLRPQLEASGLPYYAVPSQVRLIAEFPKTVTGKLDNTQLFAVPLLQNSKSLPTAQPLSGTQMVVARIFEEMLLLPFESVRAGDNFFDLGGDSGKAGVVISKMRQSSDPRFSGISVADLYSCPTVQGLAAVVDEKSSSQSSEETLQLPMTFDDAKGSRRPWLTAFIQLIVGMMLMSLDAWHLYVGYLYFYPWANRMIGVVERRGFVSVHMAERIFVLFPLLLLAWFVVYYVFNAVMLFTFKWILIGKYTPGRYRLYSGFFIRHWIVERLSRRVRWNSMYGNPALSWYLSALGAKVGKRCFIKLPDHSPLCGFDLLKFGDNVSINYAYVSPISYVHDTMVLGEVVLADESTILPRATVIGPATLDKHLNTVDVMTFHGSIAGSNVSRKLQRSTSGDDNNWLSGAPSRVITNPTLAQMHETRDDIQQDGPDQDVGVNKGECRDYKACRKGDSGAREAQSLYSIKLMAGCDLGPFLYFVVDCFLQLVEQYIACTINVAPQALMLMILPTSLGWWVYILHPLVLMWTVFFCETFYVGTLSKMVQFFLPSRKGHYHIFSFYSLMIEYKQRWFSKPQMLLNNTLFMNSWMKTCGVKIGEHVELSQIKGLPDVISIGDETFLANFTHIAVPHVTRGRMIIGPVGISSNCLIGNNACLPINSGMEENTILGVLSVPPIGSGHGNKVWIGNPPMCLPKSLPVPFPQIHILWHVKRLVGDLILISISSLWWSIMIASQLGLIYLFSSTKVSMTFSWISIEALELQHVIPNWVIVPLIIVTCRVAISLLAAVVSRAFWTPRVPVGKSSRNYNYDSNFIFRWRFYNKTWSMFVRHNLITPFEGSVWMNVIYRTTTKVAIGPWAFLASDTCFRDHNFVEIGENSVVNDEVIFRTHTFEDWKLRFEKIVVKSHCVIRPSTTIMSGAIIGEGALVDCNTLVMKNEFISPRDAVSGIPASKIATMVDNAWNKEAVEDFIDAELGLLTLRPVNGNKRKVFQRSNVALDVVPPPPLEKRSSYTSVA